MAKTTAIPTSPKPMGGLADPLPNDWSGVILDFLGLVAYVVLWTITFLIKKKYRDFTFWFMICQLIPLTLITFFQFILDFNYRATFLGGAYKWPEYQPEQGFAYNLFTCIHKVLRKTMFLNLQVALIMLFNACIWVARTRQTLNNAHYNYAFFYALGVSFLFGLADGISLALGSMHVPICYNYIINIIGLITAITSFLALCCLCCCSYGRVGMPSEPYVANARSRMWWTWLFVSFGFQCASTSESLDSLYDAPTIIKTAYGNFITLSSTDTAAIQSLGASTSLFCSYLQPFALLLSAVFFWSPYRSTVFCRQGYDNNQWAQRIAPLNHVGVVNQLTAGIEGTPGPFAYQAPDGTMQYVQFHPEIHHQQQQTVLEYQPVYQPTAMYKPPIIVAHQA